MCESQCVGAIALAAYILLESSSDEDDHENEKQQRKRAVWTKQQWLRRRETDGYCVKLMDELRSGEPRDFVRMTAQQFDHLLALVRPHIEKADTNMRLSIPARERLALTLRYLAAGEHFNSLQYIFCIPATTISGIIPEVLDAIYKVLVDDSVKLPKTETEWKAVAREFNDRWQFPNCIGAVGGKHVVMVAPSNTGRIYYNYKGTHSIILLGTVDANYKLMYVDVGRHGRLSDGDVFNCCTFGQALATNQLCLPPPKALPGREIPVPYVLVADDAIAMRPNIMKPYAQRGLTMLQRVFNYRLSRARHIIDNVFGIMSARFRVLRKPIHLDAAKTNKVTLACCVLHNYLITTNKEKYAPSTSFDQYDDQDNLLVAGDWRADDCTSMYPLEPAGDCTNEGKSIQNEFAAYFSDEGEVEWQYTHI